MGNYKPQEFDEMIGVSVKTFPSFMCLVVGFMGCASIKSR